MQTITIKKVSIKAKILGLLFLTAITSCEEQPVYEEFVEVSQQGWYKDSVINFEVEISDTNAAYQVVWYLRNNDNYPYSNIYLFRKVSSQRGIEFGDTAEFTLADPYGKWLGKGVGELKTNTWPFKEQLLFFRSKGTYTFSLQQAMRADYLEGVEDVGLGIYKVESEEKDGEEES